MSGNGLVEANHAGGERGASARHLPGEVYDLIVAFLLDTHDFFSAASLNRSCSTIHASTISRLWKAVTLKVPKKRGDLVESVGLRELTESEGFKYTR
jgi:hypothetical protein